jgi:hypothetical protein
MGGVKRSDKISRSPTNSVPDSTERTRFFSTSGIFLKAGAQAMTAPDTGGERRGTRVTFLDQTGAKSVEAVIADTVPVRRIMPNIITKMNLPVMGPDGQPMSYSLDHKEGGRRLREDQTLPQAQVRDGDHLIVYPEIVAGGNNVPKMGQALGSRAPEPVPFSA